jgi:replicative DNA helicase
MAEKRQIVSEGAALDGFLDELQQERQIQEISGCDSGFANLNRALDGILPGLYLLIGPPACGKTSFAKQLLDQLALSNDAIGLFFSFSESKRELRIKTLARLSGIEHREIRRGSAYLLHWYGTPRLAGQESEQLSPSWEKVKRCAEDARVWLDSIFLLECSRGMTAQEVEAQTREILRTTNKQKLVIVIDDCQRLGSAEQSLELHLPLLTESLAELARSINAALIAVWPDLAEHGRNAPQDWAEKVLSPDVIMVLEQDPERTIKLSASARPINLHVVKNRAGERGKIAFDFQAAFARFTEVS